MAAGSVGDELVAECLMEGTVHKRGQVNKSFKKRYAALTLFSLSYFKNEKAREPAGTIAVADVTGVDIMAAERKPTFVTHTSQRDYIFQVASDDMAAEWVDSIAQARREYAGLMEGLAARAPDSAVAGVAEAGGVGGMTVAVTSRRSDEEAPTPYYWANVTEVVEDPQAHKKKFDARVYVLAVHTDTFTWTVRRKHVALLKLHQQLKLEFPDLRFANIRRLLEDAGEDVASVLESYLMSLVCSNKTNASPLLHVFLSVTDNLNELARTQCWPLVRVLIEAGLFASEADSLGLHPVHYAAMGGRADMIRLIQMTSGAVHKMSRGEGYSALHVAVQHNQFDALRALLQCDLNANTLTSDRQSALHFAAELGSVEAATILINDGMADVNIADSGDWTALHIASQLNHADLVRLLLEKGALVDNQEREQATALFLASNKGWSDVVGMLVDAGASPTIETQQQLPVHVAAYKGHAPVVARLLDAGTDVNAQDAAGMTALHYAAQEGHTAVAEVLLERDPDLDIADTTGETPVYLAARECANDIALMLLQRGAAVGGVRKNGQTLLHPAAYGGDAEVVSLILATGGVDVNAADSAGKTALHYAAAKGPTAAGAVRALVEAGGDVRVADGTGETPLYSAAYLGADASVTALLAAGADPDAKQKSGWAPLHIAAHEGHTETAVALLDGGANINVADDTNTSPLYLAASKGNEGVVATLLSRQCDVNMQRTNGQSALHIAAFKDFVRVMAMLIKCGGDVNAVDSHEQRAFDYCSVDAATILETLAASVEAGEDDGQ